MALSEHIETAEQKEMIQSFEGGALTTKWTQIQGILYRIPTYKHNCLFSQ